jgi:hypothetical protein
MLKFSGKRKCFREFMDKLIETYGAKTTIKEVSKMIGALKIC